MRNVQLKNPQQVGSVCIHCVPKIWSDHINEFLVTVVYTVTFTASFLITTVEINTHLFHVNVENLDHLFVDLFILFILREF